MAGHSFHKYSQNMYNPQDSSLHISLSDLYNWMRGMSNIQGSRVNPVHGVTKNKMKRKSTLIINYVNDLVVILLFKCKNFITHSGISCLVVS